MSSTPGGGSGPPPDTTPPDDGDPPPGDDNPPLLPTETQRVAVQSPCGQVVLECESSQPVAIVVIQPDTDQFVTLGDNSAVFTGSSPNGIETVQLIGSQSVPGIGATQLTYSWSYGGTDAEPDSLAPGPEFSTQPDPLVRLGVGFHYLRLTVHNGTQPAREGWSPDNLQANFKELQVEIRTSQLPFIDGR